jgi:lysozyme
VHSERKTNDRGVALVKHFEGVRLRAYRDPVGILTIGYGHTGADVHSGLVISLEQAEEILRFDLRRFERGVTGLVKVPLNDNQFAALVSFAFNLGVGALGRSTLLKKLNAGDYKGAYLEFGKWTRAGGRVLPGLVRRRAAEAQLFLLGVHTADDTVTL